MANKTIPTILTNEGNVGIGISRSASLNTTAAANGTGGGNRGFDTSFSSTTTGFTGSDSTDQGFGYFAATIVAGRSYEVSATMVVTNGAPLSFITSSGLNFATQTVQSIASPPVSNTTYRFVATANAAFFGIGINRTSGTMTAVVSNFSIKEVGSALVTSDTNVGIGTTSPDSLLHLNKAVAAGSNNFVLRLQNPTTVSDARVGILFSDNADTASSADGAFIQVSNNGVDGGGNMSFGKILDIAATTNVTFLSNGNVGIGITNPSSKLHIDDASTPYITISRAGVPTWQLRNNYPNNQYGFSFNNTTAGTVPLFIGAGGNIGIGLDSPAAKLDIVGTNTTIALSFGSTVPNNPLFINTYAGSMGIGMDQTTAGIRLAGDYSSAAYPLVDIGYYSGGTVSHANWVNRLRVQQNGNVGIGTTVPTYRLDIEGASTTSVVQNVRNPSTAWTQYALTRYQTDTKDARYVDVGYFRGAGAETTRGFVISGLSSNILTLLEPSAYLGLGGVTAPLFNIDVASTQGKGIQLRYDTSTGYRAQITPYWNSSTDTRIDFAINRTANVVADVIMSVGYGSKVGIGTTAPTGTLTIQSNSNQLRLQTATGPGAYFTNISSFYDSTHPFAIEVANNSSSTAEYFGIYSDAGGANSRPVFPNGNVGIGTTRPSGKLTVQGNIEVNYNSTTADTSVRRSFLTTHATINRGANITFGLFDGGSNPMGMTVYNVAAAAGAYNSQFITFYTHEGGVSEGERMRITQLGDVGIGTFTPLSLLTVGEAGSTSAAKGLSFGGDASANLYRSAASTIKTDGSLEVATSLNIGADLYVADELGVGVLIANKRVNYGAQINAASASIQLVLGRTASSTGQGAIGADSANTFAVWNVSGGFTKQLVVTQQGNVGIGADTPNAKLQIAGTTASLLTVGTLTNDWGGVAAIGTPNGNGIILSKVNTSNDANRVLTIVRDDTNGASIFGYTPVGTSTSVGFQIRASASSYFNGGNVGIGETSPIQKLHVLGNTVFGNFGSDTYKYNLYLSFAAAADESWVRIYLPQNYDSSNNGGTVKVRVLFAANHASFGAHQEYQISYKTYYPSPFLTFSKIICTNKTTDFSGGTYYAASSTPDVVFYSNADAYLYIKIKGFSAYNTVRFVEAEVFGRTAATPTITTTTAPASPTELTKTIQFLPQEGNIYADGAIGIGITNPAHKLDIYQTSNDAVIRSKTTAAGAYVYLDSATVGYYGLNLLNAGTSKWFVGGYGTTSFTITKGIGVNEYFRIDTNGNVGIGTDNPTAKLVVMGDDVQNYAKSSVPTAIIAGDDVEFLIGTTDNVDGEEITLRMGSVLNTYYDKGAYIKAIQGANVDRFKLAFGTSDGATATTKMTIANDGNVGIGTTGPNAPLDVQSNAGGTAIIIRGRADNSTALRFYANNGTTQQLYIGTDDSNIDFVSVSTRPIRFFVNALLQHQISQLGVFSWKNGAGGDRMTLNSAGLGIGTASPTTLLSVGGAGSTLPASGITFGGNSVANLYRSEADHIKTDGSFVVTNTLIVGGGQNGIRILKNGSDSISSNLYIANAANTRVFNFQQNAAGTNLALWGYNSSNTFQNLVNFNYNGSVGIGTITPSGKLHIVSTIAGETVLRTDGTNGTLFSVVDDLSDSLMSVNNSAGLPVLEVFADDRVVAGQYGSGDFVLINNKVGIGTTNPTNKLSVIGGASIGSSAYNLAVPTNGLLVEGNVGVGTTSVGNPLEVYGTSMDPSLTPSAASIFNVNSLGVELAVGRMVTSPFSIWLQGKHATVGGSLTYPIVLNPLGGNVGIGLTNPTYKFQVIGGQFGTLLKGGDLGAGSDVLRMLKSDDTIAMIVRGDGLVGIGTASPNGRLDVRTAGQAGVPALGTAGNGINLTRTDGQTGGSIGYTTEGHIYIQSQRFDSVNANNLFLQPVGGNLGIGLTTPAYKLDVSGIIAVSNSPFADKVNNYNRIYEPAGNGAIYLGNASDPANYYDNSSHSFRSRAGSSLFVVIDGNGSVGIGTNSVAGKFDVYASGNAGHLAFIRNLSAGSSAYSALVLRRDGDTNGLVMFTNSSTRTTDGGAGNSTIRTDNGKLLVGAGATTYHSFETNGNVGIGLTNPAAARLHIKGDGSNPVLRVETADLQSAIGGTAGKTFAGWLPIMTGAAAGDKVFIPIYKT